MGSLASEQQPFHLDHRLLGVSPGTVRILFWWKVGFKDRFQPALLLSCRPDPARSFVAAQSFRTKAFYEGLSAKMDRNTFAGKFSLLFDGIAILAAEIARRHWALMIASGDDAFYLGDNPAVLQRTDNPRDGSHLGFDVAATHERRAARK